MKKKYKCELVHFVEYQPGQWVALVRRHEMHERLGPCDGGLTRTSLIIRIDFLTKEFETLNSIYCYGD